MAESSSGSSSAPWIAFLVGILVVALIIVGVYAFNGMPQPQEQAQLEVNMPDMPDVELPEAPKINPPEVPDVAPPQPTETAPAPQ